MLTLAVSPPDFLTWTWLNADPHHWDLEESADGVTGWAVADSEPGNSRGFAGADSGQFYRVRGFDVLNAPVTPMSNIVQVP